MQKSMTTRRFQPLVLTIQRKAHNGLKPLVIRNKDAKNINNNVALAHCVHLQIGCKSKTDLLSTSINSDNLSEKNKNLCLVINNKLLSEVQP